MFDYMENLELISSFHLSAKTYRKIENRQSHGFIIKVKGGCDYILDSKTIHVNEGEMVFLPKGISYECETPDKDNLYTSINFQADLVNPSIKVYSLKDFYVAQYLHRSFSELWTFGNASDRYKCISLFYDLISYISRLERQDASEKDKYHVIDPAVKYLKSHLYDNSLKIKDLHLMCGISDTYFRKIFKKRFNVTPQNYVIQSRLDYAKSIFESGDFDSVKEVAELVGYDDSMYFGKAFKKKYGQCPTSFNE